MDLEQRVGRLERENRRLKIAGGAVVAVLLTVALVGAVLPQGIPEVIHAREFQVVDESGTVRATLGASAIRYFDENSHQHVRMSDEGISAEGLIRAAGYADPASSDPRQLIDGRGASSHDLWHVVTGYGRDLLGEIALLHFTWVQTRNTGLILPCWLGLVSPRNGREGRRLIFAARRRARRAAWLPVVDWEALLPEPLPAVRERLGVGPPPRYDPVWQEPSVKGRGLEPTAG